VGVRVGVAVLPVGLAMLVMRMGAGGR
jgi:hypothetical protein